MCDIHSYAFLTSVKVFPGASSKHLKIEREINVYGMNVCPEL